MTNERNSSHSELDTIICIVIKDLERTCRYVSVLAERERPDTSRRLKAAADAFANMYDEAVVRGNKCLST